MYSKMAVSIQSIVAELNGDYDYFYRIKIDKLISIDDYICTHLVFTVICINLVPKIYCRNFYVTIFSFISNVHHIFAVYSITSKKNFV